MTVLITDNKSCYSAYEPENQWNLLQLQGKVHAHED